MPAWIDAIRECPLLLPTSDTSSLIQSRVVNLKIQGDGKDGYHLCMSPEGCFTADTWHETLEDAMGTAHRIFGVSPGKWI